MLYILVVWHQWEQHLVCHIWWRFAIGPKGGFPQPQVLQWRLVEVKILFILYTFKHSSKCGIKSYVFVIQAGHNRWVLKSHQRLRCPSLLCSCIDPWVFCCYFPWGLAWASMSWSGWLLANSWMGLYPYAFRWAFQGESHLLAAGFFVLLGAQRSNTEEKNSAKLCIVTTFITWKLF